jgi:hypothetical protein
LELLANSGNPRVEGLAAAHSASFFAFSASLRAIYFSRRRKERKEEPDLASRTRHSVFHYTPGENLATRLHLSAAGVQDMPLINIVIALIVVGVLLWLVNNYIPMASSIKTILNIVVVVAVAVWVLQAVGLWSQVTSYKFN